MNLGKTLVIATVLVAGALNLTSASGQTWTRISALNEQWVSVVVSPDGNKLVAGSLSGLYLSTNFGSSWAEPPTMVFNSVPSADGTKWVGQDLNDNMYLSTNSAISWNQINMTTIDGFELSLDGSNIVSDEGSAIAYSTNWGISSKFISPVPTGILYTAANGTKWFLLNNFSASLLFCSTNQGAAWTSNSLPSTNVACFAMSADGNKILAAEEIRSNAPSGTGGASFFL